MSSATDATMEAPGAPPPRTEYGEWLAHGRAHQRAGRLIDALVCYRRALNANAYAVQARYRMGEVLLGLGREEEARAVWRSALSLLPGHVPLQFSLAGAAWRAGDHGEAVELYRDVLAARPRHKGARIGLVLSRIGSGDEQAYANLARLLDEVARKHRWNDLAHALETAPASPTRRTALTELAGRRAIDMPPRLLALLAEEMLDAGQAALGSDVLSRADGAAFYEDVEVLRRLARVAAELGSGRTWAERYALACTSEALPGPPLAWPRRTAGEALRLAYLVAPGIAIEAGGSILAPEAYLAAIVARHVPERVRAWVYVVGDALPDAMVAALPSHVPIVAVGPSPDVAQARAIAAIDADALIDLVGVRASVGPLLAQRPARSIWTYADQKAANVPPLVKQALPVLGAMDAAALAGHRADIERAIGAVVAGAQGSGGATLTAEGLSALWHEAIEAHQAGRADRARDAYREVLGQQPDYAPAHYLLGLVLRDAGQREEAGRSLVAAVSAAARYVEPRVALANLLREGGLLHEAVSLCEAGLQLMPQEAALWRALGRARLAERDGERARQAFARALDVDGADATTHYNHGVALQMQNRRAWALRAYQRALALDPALYAADFNIGVIFREQRRGDAAISAFEEVLARDLRHVPAHKALAETLLESRRLDEWFRAFDRFEAACPDALPMACLALEVCQYRADFAALDRYIDRISRDDFKPSSETELVDCLEVLLFLLLYFDVDPDVLRGLYETYAKAAPNVYGRPLELPAQRRPGRLRVGYLSGDLRNHVMGKMMWSALRHHDRKRFELHFYALSASSDEWTERFKGFADRFQVIEGASERKAAERIAADELDILVDLGTHTRGSKPGILALKPARVQITHVASAGAVGLSTVDFKLTDAFADLPEMQRFQIEALLPMEGCVYPYREIAPAADHPYHRESLGIPPEAVVIGAFVNPLKLSRRCLTLWRQVLEAIPAALLAVSPLSPELRAVSARLFSAVGIGEDRMLVLPQGRNEAQNQARYHVVDFALDPMPYGGANGTLEALAMGIPVVTLVGAKHGERCGYSMLANLSVMQTVATSGSQYVEIAVRLATDAAFMSETRAAIRAGLQASPLTDMVAYARNLERAYERALELRYPAALEHRDG
jgi:predicted O-linked N-acetylglucosamine transferase (SPINDLY family)